MNPVTHTLVSGSSSLPVVESFLSIQGEGPSVGVPAYFIRLAGCNLSCSWCDSRHSWDPKAPGYTPAQRVPIQELADTVNSLYPRIPLLVITGGEPLLHQKLLVTFLKLLDFRIKVEVETNGTIEPISELLLHVDRFNISPKLENRSRGDLGSIFPGELGFCTTVEPPIYKFVITCPNDVYEAEDLVRRNGINPCRVYLMPEGVTRESQIKAMPDVIEAAIKFGYNLSPRLHVLVWDTKKGV